jgi:hypothetical protein
MERAVLYARIFHRKIRRWQKCTVFRLSTKLSIFYTYCYQPLFLLIMLSKCVYEIKHSRSANQSAAKITHCFGKSEITFISILICRTFNKSHVRLAHWFVSPFFVYYLLTSVILKLRDLLRFYFFRTQSRWLVTLNVWKVRFCMRGFSTGKSDAGKSAPSFV